MKEEIELDFSSNAPQVISGLEAMLAASADRFVQKLQAAGRAASTSGAGAPGANGPGGGTLSSVLGTSSGGATAAVAGLGGSLLSLGGQALQGGADAMGAAIRNTPMGQLHTAAGASKQLRAGLGGILDNTIGRAPILGDMIMAEYNRMNSAIDEPERAALGRLGPYYANLAAAGIQVDERAQRRAYEQSILVERRRWTAMREQERIAGEVNMSLRPMSHGASWLGR